MMGRKPRWEERDGLEVFMCVRSSHVFGLHVCLVFRALLRPSVEAQLLSLLESCSLGRTSLNG